MVNNGNNFLFTADIHLKLKFKDVPFVWLADRYIEFCYWLEEQRIATGATALVIGGDLFDSQPNLYELALFPMVFEICKFDEYLLYPGNHEMSTKEKSFYSKIHELYSKYTNVTFIYDKIGTWYDWQVIPYPIIKKVTKDQIQRKVMSHVRCASDRGLYSAEIDFTIFDDCVSVLLGDIHSCHTIANNIVYPGSPMDTSFQPLPLPSRFIVHYKDDGVNLIERSDAFRRLIKVETTPEKYNGIKDKIKESKNQYDVVVVVDSIADLNTVQDAGIKKKLKIDKDAVLVSTDILEDIRYYLTDILKVDVELVGKVMTRMQELGADKWK